jgi:molybdate transport system substrate-binding protein
VRRLGVVALAVAVLAAGACSGGGGGRHQVTVFAAASLTDVFKAMAKPFAAAHDNYSLTFSFAGSQQLVAQLQQGAKADALATADRATMDRVPARGPHRPPRVFAANRLVIAVRRGNPDGVRGLADLARSGLRVELAAPAVPAGRYAREALSKAHVSVNPVSLEDNVEGVVTKVALGEADAGIVYATDTAAGRGVEAVPIPDDHNVRAEYLVDALPFGDQRAGGQAFVDFLFSTQGQSLLQRFGFLRVPSS